MSHRDDWQHYTTDTSTADRQSEKQKITPNGQHN